MGFKAMYCFATPLQGVRILPRRSPGVASAWADFTPGYSRLLPPGEVAVCGRLRGRFVQVRSTKLIHSINKAHSFDQQSSFVRSTKLIRSIGKAHSCDCSGA